MTDPNKEFSEIISMMDTYNSTGKWKRFYTISQTGKNDKFTTVGFHDYKTKKYFLTDLRSHDSLECLKDMKSYVSKELSALNRE